MTSNEIRSKFQDFFRSKQHHIVSSAPMVVKNDPTLMFTNAGMNQFKEIFLGNAPVTYPRIANTQKCLRVSGKHNDLEEVGFDTYHHTMFEMLGNWSFGNYFKKEAIEWAWELLHGVYGIDKDRLYITVFEGAKEDNIDSDAEAFEIWKGIVSEDRIIYGNKKDNFWEMGDTGPCGPCSEIHVDIRSDEECRKTPGRDLVNTGNPLVIEIWNLVFIEYNRLSSGQLVPLPAKHVDTGMGFERLSMVLQKKQSNYDTDIFQPVIQKLASMSGKRYGEDLESDIAMRVIADHLRAVTFAIADGQLPSNIKAGYVIRRILRRALRFGYSFLQFKEPFIHLLVPTLVENMGDTFKELRVQQELIMKVITEEENAFLRTLAIGIQKFDNYVQSNAGLQMMDGRFAFELFDTYGFPVDLTQLMAGERNMTVDMEAFNAGMMEQKARSRQASVVDTDDWVELITQIEEPFLGWDFTEYEVRITKYRKVKAKGKTYFQLVFDQTPFYGEAGGQIGDTGYLFNEEEKIMITDTLRENNLIIHLCDTLPQNPSVSFIAVVDKEKRDDIARNHSATHLMHKALRQVLGSHVEQKGSLVDTGRLRFDFAHFQKLTDDEIKQVEQIVNQMIRANETRNEFRAIPMDQAVSMGAMALFGEKYGEKVRVIQFGESLELCGGTHVVATGTIGFFKIVSESAIAAGIRRIEAITGINAEQWANEQSEIIEKVKVLVKAQKDIVKSVETMLEENNLLRKQIAELQKEKALSLKSGLLEQMENINGINFLSTKIALDAQGIKDLVFEIKSATENVFLVFGTLSDGKVNLTVALSEQLVKDKGFDAAKIVRDLATDIQGGGGGQAFFATAGGKKPDGLDKALARARNFIL
jgi:alanyl-tRNA synthetase